MTYNALDESSSKIFQPDFLNVGLMEHQKTSINAMLDLETKGYIDINFRYFANKPKDLRIDTNIGILGDLVGSGKTLIVSTLLALSPVPPKRINYYESNRYTIIKDGLKDGLIKDESININVLMVPKAIQHQWKECFDKQLKEDVLNYIYLHNVDDKDLLNDISKKCEQKSIIILCNEKTISYVFAKTIGQKWNRLIIDEVDTIQFGGFESDDTMYANFTWLITGTTNGIVYAKKKWLKDIFGKNITWQPDFLTIKNKKEYVDDSLHLPIPNRIVIPCFTPSEVKLIKEHIPKHVMNMINAGNTDEAIKTLNCHIDTPDNIFKVISNNYAMAINNKKIELEAENKKKYQNPEKNMEHLKRVKKLEIIIKNLESRLKSMKEAIYEANDEMCPICMGEFEKPTLVDCCGHVYCFNCLTITLQMNFGVCPICAKSVTKNRMHVLADDEINKLAKNEIINQKEKIDALLDIFRLNKNGKYLIFADYDKTFAKIEVALKKNNIKYGILSTSALKTKKTIEAFSNGSINCIMLNARNFGAGINLQCATDIILYHRFSKAMEEQIIGRGQRLGRTTKLNVYYLIHDNEQKSFDNDVFEDLDYQQYLETLGDMDTTNNQIDVIVNNVNNINNINNINDTNNTNNILINDIKVEKKTVRVKKIVKEKN